MEINSYQVTTQMPIIITVDADATSTVISWDYTCSYDDNGCVPKVINGSEKKTIEFDSNITCYSNRIDGEFVWHGNTILYRVIQSPIKQEKPTEYVITNIEGGIFVNENEVDFPNILLCSEAYESELTVDYEIHTYTGVCDFIGETTYSSTTVPFIFDCSNKTDGGVVTSYVSILGNDIQYHYHCAECEGERCTPTTTISNPIVTQLYINNIRVSAIPCSGAAQGSVSCDVKYDTIATDEYCKKTTKSYTNRFTLTSAIDACVEGECCRNHSVRNSINIDGNEIPISVTMKGDSNKTCFSGCGEPCEARNTATLDNWSVTFISGGTSYEYYDYNIQDMPVFMLEQKYNLTFKYTLSYKIVNEACQETSGTVQASYRDTIESATCSSFINEITITNFNENVCTPQTPTFRVTSHIDTYPMYGSGALVDHFVRYIEIQTFRVDDTTYEIDGVYPTIRFQYDRQKCKVN